MSSEGTLKSKDVMSKVVRVPIVLNGQTIILSKREYGLFTILKEGKGSLVHTEFLKNELEVTIDHLRMTKKSLQEKIKDYYRINALYGIGYLMEDI